MMSLSDEAKGAQAGEKTWQAYEMGAVKSAGLGQIESDGEFVAFQPPEETDEVFLPFHPMGNTAAEMEKQREDALQRSQRTVAKIEQEAYEKGFAQGEKDGFALGEKKSLKVIEHMEHLLEQLAGLQEHIVKRDEKEIVEVLFAVAEKIVQHQVQVDETVVKASVMEALALAAERREICFSVHPDDYDYVETLRPELFARLKDLKTATVSADPSILRGGCFLETVYGDVDARMEKRLENVYQALMQTLSEQVHE